MNGQDWPYLVEPMRLEDIEEVIEIESRSFPVPWSARAYQYELMENDLAHYIVVRPRVKGVPYPRIIGYGGFWMELDEAHISTIAVRPRWRGRGIGELLLLSMLEMALRYGARLATLEVRVSNKVARNLYRKCGFQEVGLRRRYYSDNGEDAIIMTTPPLRGPEFQARLTRLKEALGKRLIEENRLFPLEELLEREKSTLA